MPEPATLTLSFPEPTIAVLTLDMPGKGANILSSSVLDELAAHLDTLEGRADLEGLVIISGKPGQFIAGADLREFAASLEIPPEKTVEMCRRGQTLFGRLSQGPFVSVAAIDGICVGGGAELAAWCDRRVMTDNPATELGFPEVKLGLYPGWGGTVRAPRIVGLGNAVEMITTGNSVDAREALTMGWVSDVVPAQDLLNAAIRVAKADYLSRGYLKDRQRWSGPIEISDTELGFLGATASALIQQQTKGQYPAPVAALETMLGGAGCDADAACQLEAEGMSQLFGSPINAALLNIFFLTDRNKKDAGVADKNVTPGKLDSVAVIGAGIMGAGIAAANVKRKIRVCLTDARPEALATGVQNVLQEVAYNKALGKPDLDQALQFAPLLNATSSDEELTQCDLVLEAVIENIEIKKLLYDRLESHMHERAILATNTSTIPIGRLAEGLARPDQFLGIHFFNPVRKMKLVEVIRGAETSDEAVATAVAYAKRIGKSPIVVNDGPGFLVNRLLMPYMNEALELVAEGVAIKDIERASRSFGMPMGPIALYDMVGLDTALYAGRVLCEAFPDRFAMSPVLPSLVKAGRLGQKSGSGFYSYANKKKRPEPDAELDRYLTPYARHHGNSPTDERQLVHRLFLIMLLEATRVWEEKLVRNVRDIDLALIFGIGFPPFRGGLIYWADTLGATKIVELLKPLESLGERFRPTPVLLELAKSNKKFYEL
ncbi:MAG: 3-hydroxyacyl-CoA dehydrogenase NAD-binding domain-containing protein [Pirellulaceae bacterium]